ncbi:MAG: hypothetical protein Q8904_12830 [Bacteroidota bacterium]|nr:hypothetical protein [Bacteroidota bacterium]
MIFTQEKVYCFQKASRRMGLLLLCLLLPFYVLSQDKPAAGDRSSLSAPVADSVAPQLLSVPERFFKKVDSRINNFDRQVTRRTDKALSRMIKQEERLKRLMAKSDALTTRNLFTRGMDSLKHFQQAISSKTQKLSNSSSLKGEYFPYLDTLKSSLSFLKNTESLSFSSAKTPAQLTDALARIKAAEAKLQYSEKIKSYLRNRQLELRQQLEHLSGYDKAKGEMDKMKKEMYYYNRQLSSYKEMLGDPSRLEAEATKLLQKIPAFQKYLSQNGALAALFQPQASTNQSGLQTREMVNKLIKDQMGLLGPDGDKIIEEHLQEARQEMDKLKQQAAGEGDAEIPGFKPNGEKTKSLWQRVEIGTDCQFNKNNTLLPSTGDFGLSIAYRIMKNGTIGIGGSWKMGMGKDINHIRFTHEGICMRSFVEYAIWKGFNLRGGWERTFLVKQVTTENLILLKKPGNWLQSGLIGISKKMSLPLKVPVLKKKTANGSVQLLYDFLHDSHTPATPALQLRVGMGL